MATIDELMATGKQVDENDVNKSVEEMMSDSTDEKAYIDSKINDPMALYMREMARYKLYTAEEEVSKFRELNTAESDEDRKAIKEDIFNHNLRLVVYVTKKYYKNCRYVEPMDLINEASIGLMKAIDRYDVEMGYKFSTYAYWWISQACRRFLANDNDIIRQPVHIHDAIVTLKKAEKKWEQENEGEAPIEWLSKETKFTEDKVRHLQEVRASQSHLVSLDMSISKESGDTSETEFSEIIADPKSYDDYDRAEMSQFEDRMVEILRTACKGSEETKERLVDIIKRRFGFDGRRVETLEEIGDSYGVSRERIRQLEAQGIRIFRNPRYRREFEAWK